MCPLPLLLCREWAQFFAAEVCSTHRGDRYLTPLIHFAAFAHSFHFGHDVSERLLHRLLQDPALALAFWVVWVCQSGQGGVDILQACGYSNLQRTGLFIA